MQYHFKEIIDEIKIFEGINHPNLVKYYGVEVHRVSVRSRWLEGLEIIVKYIYRLLDSLVEECWQRVLGVPGSIPSQGPPPR